MASAPLETQVLHTLATTQLQTATTRPVVVPFAEGRGMMGTSTSVYGYETFSKALQVPRKLKQGQLAPRGVGKMKLHCSWEG